MSLENPTEVVIDDEDLILTGLCVQRLVAVNFARLIIDGREGLPWVGLLDSFSQP